jgi:hypothetical protein
VTTMLTEAQFLEELAKIKNMGWRIGPYGSNRCPALAYGIRNQYKKGMFDCPHHAVGRVLGHDIGVSGFNLAAVDEKLPVRERKLLLETLGLTEKD